ncbi:MAG: META domain-containing protein [Chloroflexota bacterium]|nr:META domain-containing protein [Chloroflexota bacterium]
MVDSYPITLVISEDSVSGTSACNGYGAELSSGDGSFRVAEIGGTAMACAEEVMASETAYLAALGRVTAAALESDELLLEGDGVELRFRPLASPPIGELTDATWRLETLTTGLTATGAQGDATLRLDSNGTLTGSTGCRTLRGRYVVVGGEILATRLAADGECSAVLADQDGHIVSVLGDGFRAAVEGDRLVLTSTGAQGLIYRLAASASATPSPAPSVFQGSIAETSHHVTMLLLERTSRDMCVVTVEIDYDEVGLRKRALELAEDAGPGPRRLAPDLYLGSLEEAIDGFRGTELLAVTGIDHWVWYLARPQDAEPWGDDPLPEMVAAVLLRVELPDGREVWWRNGAYIAVKAC